MPSPPLPENVRIARLSDLTRIGIVSTAAFFNSPVFHYFRPEYKDHLQDTVASYRASCAKEILDPDTVVIVAEDTLKEDESVSVFPELRRAYPPFHDQIPTYSSETRRVVVGVASLSLKAVPALSGQFLPDDENPEEHCNDPEDRGRDKYPEAFKLSFVTEEEQAKEK
ncbi:hypothetical protein BFW01_g1854 [Lasiodiplodia theobromae]|uniref:Uncharacterized protein n=1 Tax=Lasiodiplodia theobromae TaxID=45133 RepID=A0A8H7MCY4_9PEZI|nr:hypothetical protein BFW01_g1854 [Lasiodiplodia theobromae]